MAPRHRDRRRAPPQLAARRSLARRETAPHLRRHEPIARTIATTAHPTITTPMLRLASAPRSGAGGLDLALGRATDWLLRDGRGVLKTVRERRKPCGNYRSRPASR